MAYQYNGKLTGELDPWQQPGAFGDEEGPKDRPDVPAVPNINWNRRLGRWEVKHRENGKTILIDAFAPHEYEEAIATRIATYGPIPEPRPRYMERPDKPHMTGLNWDRGNHVWGVRIYAGGRRIHIGTFGAGDYNKAVEALQSAKAKYFPNGENVRQLKPCGTHAAYQRHVKRGEPIDDACRRAEYEYVETHRRKKAA